MFRHLCFMALCLTLSLTLLPAPALAGDQDNCTSVNLNLRVAVYANIPDDLPVGTPVPGSDFSFGVNIKCSSQWSQSGSTCDGGGGWSLGLASGAIPTLVPGYTDVYTYAGMPAGIGYQVLDPAGQLIHLDQNNRHDTGVPIQSGTQIVPVHFRVVKISNELSTSGTYYNDMNLSCYGNEWANGSAASSMINMAIFADIITQTCSLQEPDVQVQLPLVSRSAFKGIGESAGSAPFNLDFQCDSDADARFNISDVTNLANATDTLILLPGSTASGLGIRLRQGGNPVMLAPNQMFKSGGSEFPLRNLTTGQSLISLPFVAEYVQTDENLVSGTVMAQGMVTIDYN